ncbi:hypothetical protein V8G54_010177 [Vigna mungo]|uniref:Uncharacterized protein n=1 Tax=Vigna mungo TaxID=3915 RepID=A0AAQ3NWK0_VIGMU
METICQGTHQEEKCISPMEQSLIEIEKDDDAYFRNEKNIRQILGEVMQTPSETMQTPSETMQTPCETMQTPGETMQTPGETMQTPGETMQIPLDPKQIPFETTQILLELWNSLLADECLFTQSKSLKRPYWESSYIDAEVIPKRVNIYSAKSK